MSNPFANAPVKMRPELPPALARALAELGQAGEWLTAAQRAKVAAEARQAWSCKLCAARKDALSPGMVSGDHDAATDLPAGWVDAIHRVVTDSGRLTKSWLDGLIANEILEDEYIELVSVSIITTVIDAFALGIGMTPPALPAPSETRAPPRQRRADASPGPGWVATIAPEDAAADFQDFYAGESTFFIRRSLTLVPGEVRRFWELMNPLYLEDPRINELDGEDRGITRAQMEFLASRASMLLGCYY
jgi:hypothetical protein